MQITTNVDDFRISQKQAKSFAIQVLSGMKVYISEHKADFEKWQKEQEENDET